MDKNTVIKTPITTEEIEQLENIELLFFAYRDFITDSDNILAQYSFGRAHHRALYFVNRAPGMTVANLLSILKITKQSLSRVLKDLINSGYISQFTGTNDRRKRLLYPTQSGRDLIITLSKPQSKRINEALEKLPSDTQKNITEFLQAMLNDKSK